MKQIGSANSTTRTADQTAAANYWGLTNATATIASIIRSVASTQGGTLADHARLFARAYTNAADALIVTWREKARYSFWRPFTAIHDAASDGNNATEADPAWTALIATPPYPDHPSGLSAFGCSVVDTMQHFYGRDQATFTGTTPGGVPRTFTSYSQGAPTSSTPRWSASTSGSPTPKPPRSTQGRPLGQPARLPLIRTRALALPQRQGTAEERPWPTTRGSPARRAGEPRRAARRTTRRQPPARGVGTLKLAGVLGAIGLDATRLVQAELDARAAATTGASKTAES